MRVLAAFHKYAVTIGFLGAFAALPFSAAAEPAREAELLRELADPATPDWQRVEADLQREWSRSGSAAMDLLLQRGEDALQGGDLDAAVEHLTALTDHAPDFAEGWNALATAYYMQGRFGPSLADIQRTLALNPNHYGALAGLGIILEEMGRDEEAAGAYRASLAIHPHQDQVKEALTRLEQSAEGISI